MPMQSSLLRITSGNCTTTSIEREQILVAKLPEFSVRILGLATEHGRLTVSQIVDLTHANRNTVKKHLQALVAKRP
jgi:Fic family protein